MADVKKIKITSLILTSKEVVHNKEYRIRPQGIHCLLRAKQFSGVTLVEKAIFTEHQEMQSQMVLCFMLKFLGFQERKEKDVVLFCCNSMALLDLPSEETQPVNKFLQFYCSYLTDQREIFGS